MSFDTAMNFVRQEEGGLSDRPLADDPGGLTMLGVTQATLDNFHADFPTQAQGFPLDVAKITQEQATTIYWWAYWLEAGCDQLPQAIAIVVFNAAVQSGPTRAIRWLQEALGVNVDGLLGPKTRRAALSASPKAVISTYLSRQIVFETQLSNWQSNKNGWTKRLFRLAWEAAIAA